MKPAVRPTHSAKSRPVRRAAALAAALACGLAATAPVQAVSVVWGGGSGSWMSGPNWIGGTAPGSSSDWVFIDGGALASSAVTLATGTATGRLYISVGDALSITSGASLALYGGLLDNAGRLSLDATAADNVQLRLNAATLLSGSGSTVLNSHSSGYRAIVVGSASNSLTVGAGHTLRGAGDLGSGVYGALTVVNQGTVIAEGGTLNTYGSFNNTAGLIQVADGAALTGNTISGGTVQSLGTAGLGGSFSSLVLAGDYTTNSVSLTGVSIANLLQASGNNALTTAGNLTVNGQLRLAASTSDYARAQLGASTTLSGTGSTVLASHPSGYRAIITGPSGRVLTIASGHTLRGNGDLGNGTYGQLAVVNQGTVIAEGGALTTYGSFDNSAGLVQVADGAALTGNTISGGTVQSLGAATLGGSFVGATLAGDFTTGGISLTSVRIDGLLQASGNNALTTAGNLTVNGQLRLAASTSDNARAQLGASTTLSGTGSTVLDSHPSGYRAIINGASGRVLTVAAGHTLRGAGDLGNGTYGQLAVVNQGTVIAEGGTLSTYGSFNNTAGLVQVADGAVLSAGSMAGGTVQSLGAASIGGNFSGVTLAGSFATSSVSLTNVRIDGVLQANGNNTLTSDGNLAVNGQLRLLANSSANARMQLGASTTLSGPGSTVLANDGSGYRAMINGASSRVLTVASGHTLRGNGDLGNGTYGTLAMVNQGSVIAEGGTLSHYGTLNNTAGLIQVAGGATFSTSGTAGGSVQSLGAASLGGDFSNLALTGSFAASTLSLSNVSIADVLNVGGSLTTSGSLAVAGQLQLAATGGSHARMSLGANTTLSGSGSTVLSGHDSGYRALISGGTGRTLTIASGHTLRGSGNLGDGTYGTLALVNQGTVIAEAGTLSSYGSFNNAAGLVQIADGGQLTLSSDLSGGTVQGLGAGSRVQGGTLKDVTLTGTLAVTNGATLQVGGSVTNNGLLTLAGAGGHTRLALSSSTTLGGSGTTVLSSDSSGYRAVVTGGTGRLLTVAAGHTLRGVGDLGSTTYGALAVANRSTVIAEGGTLNLYGSFDNAAGLVQVAGDALLSLGGEFSGGTLQGLGAGSRVQGSALKDVTLTGTLAVTNGATLNVSGSLTNNGLLALAGEGAHTRLALNTSTTLAGSGTTALSSDSSGYRAVITGGTGRVLTIAAGHTLRGAGDLGSTTYGALAVANQGKVIAEGGTLGTYGSFDNAAGLVQVAGGTLLNLGGDFSGGTLQGLGTTSRIQGSTLKDVTLTGTLAVTNGATLNVSGSLTNNGLLTLAGEGAHTRLTLANSTVLGGSGITQLSSDSSGYRGMVIGGTSRVLTIDAGHTLRGAGDLGSTIYGALAVVNHGTVSAAGGTLGSYGSFDNRDGTLAVAAGSTLSFASALLLGDDSLLRVGVTGSSGDASVGLLSLSGAAAFDGDVVLDLSGYSAAVGDSFSFASYTGSYSGAFDSVLASGYTLSVSYADHRVTATITGVSAVPEPSTWALWLAGLVGVAGIARRRRAAA